MRDAEEGETEVSRGDGFGPPRLDQPGGGKTGLLQPAPGEREREREPVDRGVGPFRKEGKRPHVIFVAVRQQNGVDRNAPERREVGGDPVDAGKRLVRKRDADVDDEVRPAARQPEHVASELTEAPERDERDVRAGRHGVSSRSARAT